MRVNDQEDMFILEASCLSCRLPGGTTWPMTSGACWRPCCPGEEAGPYAQVEQAAAQPHAGSVRFRDAAVSA